jgi:hypothetical protein
MRYLLLIVMILGLAGCIAVPVGFERQQHDNERFEMMPTSRFQFDEAEGTGHDLKTKLTEPEFKKRRHWGATSVYWAEREGKVLYESA